MVSSISLLVSCVLLLPFCDCENLVTVTTDVGEIVGVEENVSLPGGSQHVVHIFKGIPYALPPVGPRRFSLPQPSLPFSQPFQALHFGPACPQRAPVAGNTSEDCLTLNIYSPAEHNSSLPVLVWIHGGAHVSGEGRQLAGENLAGFGGVVVVTLNYRLGALGFLATDDETARGNWGLWDQRLALQWVQENIRHFHGDPGNVALAGTTSGAFCAAHHALYPHNRGLFRRILAESGSVIAPGVYHTSGLQFALDLATRLGCEPHGTGPTLSQHAVHCLRQKDAQDVISTTVTPDQSFTLSWAPVVDGVYVVEDPSTAVSWPLPDSTPSSLTSVDAMFGGTSSDGSVIFTIYMAAMAAARNERLRDGVSTGLFNQALGRYINSSSGELDQDVLEAVMLAVRQFYTDWEHPTASESRARQLVDIFTDRTFLVPMAILARNHAWRSTSSSTYVYSFQQPSPFRSAPFSWMNGSLHKDHDVYVLGLSPAMLAGHVINMTSQDDAALWAFSVSVMTYWTNFVKTGNPNTPEHVAVEWPAFTRANEDYLFLEAGKTRARGQYLARATSLWLDYVPHLTRLLNNCRTRGETSTASVGCRVQFINCAFVLVSFFAFRVTILDPV